MSRKNWTQADYDRRDFIVAFAASVVVLSPILFAAVLAAMTR